MDLKNNTITVGELLDNPKSKAILKKQFPTLLSHPLLAMSRKLTLAQLLPLAKERVSQEKIQATLQSLSDL